MKREQVSSIAHLARMALSEQECEALSRDLTNILDFIAVIDSADTSNTAPLAHPLEASQRLRVDEVTEPNERKTLQANAPDAREGLFVVPEVIE